MPGYENEGDHWEERLAKSAIKATSGKGRPKNNFPVCGAAVSAALGRRDACTTSCFSAAP
jgi:hypothetical protein